MPHVELPQAEFKVVMLGDSNTGKTSLVLRFAEGYYRESARSATVGAFFITKRMQVNGITCKIQIWDTAGQEQFKPLAPMYYKNAAAAILCFDVSSPQSLRTLKYWMEELHCNVPAGRIVICMAATKMDLLPSATASPPTHHNTEELQQLHAEAAQLAQDVGCLFVETSAKHNSNVTELFKVVAERVLQYQQTLKGKAALEIPVTRGVLESNELTSGTNSNYTPLPPHIGTSNGNYSSNSHPFAADPPYSSAATTTPSRRRHSTPDAITPPWQSSNNNMSSPPHQQQQQPMYYSSNDVMLGRHNSNTRSPFTTPPLSTPSSPAQSNKQYGNGGNYSASYYGNGAAGVEQAPPSSTKDDSQVIRSTANASPASPQTGVMCGDDSNPLMCGALLSSSAAHGWKDEDGNEHFHPNGSSSSSPSSCTIL